MRFQRAAFETDSPFMEDLEIIRALRGGEDPDLFEQLVERYKERVFRLALSILGPDFVAEAEEATQEIFLQVFRQLPAFRMESRFATWLYRIAYNRAIDIKRRARYRLPHTTVDSLSCLPSKQSRSDPLLAATEKEHRRLVHSCIGEMPEIYRSVLYLYYWLECDLEQISSYFEIPTGTVKSYLHRARQRLHALMKQRGVFHA